MFYILNIGGIVMDQETRELLNAIIGELDRVDKRINDKIDVMQRDINILKARNDYIDLYALYNQLEKRVTDVEKKIS